MDESSDLQDLPPLEEPTYAGTSSRPVILDFEGLPMGDVEHDNVPDIETAMTLKAKALELKTAGDLEQAVAVASQAVEAAPTLAFPFLLRADILGLLGQISAAEKDLREACRRAPTNTTAHLELARALDRRGLLEEAVKEYKEAQKGDFDPDVDKERKDCEGRLEQRKKKEEEEKARKAKEDAETIHSKPPSFEAPDGLPNPFKVLADEARSLTPEAAARLLGDPHVAGLMADKSFAEKLGRLANDPNGSIDLLQDKQFMSDMAAVIGVIGGRKR